MRVNTAQPLVRETQRVLYMYRLVYWYTPPPR